MLRKSLLNNRLNEINFYNFSNILCSYILNANFNRDLKNNSIYDTYKKLIQEINLSINSLDQEKLLKKLRIHGFNHMKQIYNNIRNPFIPDPSINFYEKYINFSLF